MDILLKVRLVVLFGLMGGLAWSQPVLSLEEAVQIALENNFQVQILDRQKMIVFFCQML